MSRASVQVPRCQAARRCRSARSARPGRSAGYSRRLARHASGGRGRARAAPRRSCQGAGGRGTGAGPATRPAARPCPANRDRTRARAASLPMTHAQERQSTATSDKWSTVLTEPARAQCCHMVLPGSHGIPLRGIPQLLDVKCRSSTKVLLLTEILKLVSREDISLKWRIFMYSP